MSVHVQLSDRNMIVSHHWTGRDPQVTCTHHPDQHSECKWPTVTIQDRNAHSLWMWHSLHHEENPTHTPVKVGLSAAPNTRCWVNSLASLYWTRLSLLSSSLFSVLFWASDVAILLSRSRLRLCSEVVSLRAQHRMTSPQWWTNLLRVGDEIILQLLILSKIAQHIT